MELLRVWEEVARELFIQGLSISAHNKTKGEIYIRRAISTLYYGIFWYLKEFVEARGTKIKEYNAHVTLRESLKAKGYEKASQYLRELHLIRKNADYDKFPNTKLGYRNWKEAFEKAYKLFNLILKEVQR